MNASKVISKKRLYIGNLDESLNEYAIMQLLKPFGKITYIEVMVHWAGPKKGLPRGYCFVEFEEKEQTIKAINALHGKLVRGKPLVVSFAHMTPEQEEGKKRNHSLNNKPSHLLSLKGQNMKNASTDEKIKAIERKLEALKQKTTLTSTQKASSRFKPY